MNYFYDFQWKLATCLDKLSQCDPDATGGYHSPKCCEQFFCGQFQEFWDGPIENRCTSRYCSWLCFTEN